MAIQPTHGHLSETSPRYADWMRVFGTNIVELEAPIPMPALLPGRGECLIYKLKISSLTAEQLDRLASWMSERWSVPVADVVLALNGPHGCPILAEDVSVSFDMRLVI